MTYDQSIFRAYDVRGTYPDQMNKQVAYAAGQAFVKIMNAKTVVVGRDVRDSGIELQEATIQGIMDAGANAIDIGVISTEMLYFAAFNLECDGGMSITASHNPKEWNGIKFIGKNAFPLTREDKLGEIYACINNDKPHIVQDKGNFSQIDLLPAYLIYMQKYIPNLTNVGRKLKIVANAHYGANGHIVDTLTQGWNIDLIKLNFEANGNFPKGTPDPLLPKNRQEIIETILKDKPDFGVAWDADADRCFIYDEKGRFFHGCYITALLISHFLKQQPGAKVVIERRLTWANLDATTKGGGTAIFSRTGHGYIKKAMRDNQAIFGGESSGHYYYQDFAYCDNGLISFLLVLDIFAQEIAQGRTVSALLDQYLASFPISLSELNYTTERATEILEQASAKFPDADQNHEDGLSVEYPDWRFNLRTSSNEPVLRFNIEAKTETLLLEKKAEMEQFIQDLGAVLRNDN